MKKTVIGIWISLLCVGTGVYVNQQSNASSPVVSTVAKSTKDSKVNTNESKFKVSKHEETEKTEEVGNATNSETQKKTDAVSKESSSVKAEAKSSTKTEIKSSVSSESKKQNSKKEGSSKSSSGSDQKTSTSNSSNASSKSNNDVVSQPVEKPNESKQEPAVESTPTPEPTRPSYACPGGVNQDVACDVILDQNHYFATYSSQAEADAAGMYYMNEVMYIGEVEITNYSVQAVYRNDHSIAYYGLNLWSNGSLIQ